MKRKIVLLSMLVLAFILGSCSSGGATTSEDVPEFVEHLIILQEYKFDPNQIELHVGQHVTLNFVNAGRVTHEFMIGRETIQQENRSNGFVEEFFATTGVDPEYVGGTDLGTNPRLSHEGFSIIVAPGNTATLKFTVTEDMVGDWLLGCFWLDGIHYLSGMRGAITFLP